MAARYDVFVSYSSRDRPVVETIARRLRDARLTPWFDRWVLTAGRSWQEEIADGIAASGACAVCVGPGDVGDWSREELEIALVRAANDRGFRVFVVLLPGVGDVSGLSPFLVTRTWVDLRAGLGDLQPLVNAVRGVPAGGGAPSPTVRENPYRGLRPFEERDADLFFGRDAEVQQALEKLRSARFLAVVGASGSGKSSLVRAGVVPALRASGTRTVAILKPGATPLEALAVHVAGADARAARDQFRAAVDGLHLLGRVALKDAPDEARLLVVVDQFEEVFTRCRDEEERRRFIENLVYAGTAPDARVVVVLTLRADFYPRCAAYPELAHLLTSHQALLGPMGEDALREAIEAPALRAGGEFEAGLVDLLLDEVEGRPGALPLLEHTLYELWEHRSGRMLTLGAYQQAGGVAGAVAHRAEAVFVALGPDEQAIARRVMLRLTEPGEGTEDTRRRAEFDELARTPAEAGAVARVVGALADARLLTTSEGVVDVAHEALIRGWPRLHGWIDEDRDRLRVHRRLAETAEEWERLDRDPGLLFRGVRLAEGRALDRADLNEREQAFLVASGAQESDELEQVRELARTRQRAARRLVWAAAILLVGVVVSGATALYALDARDDAEQQATVALARQLVVQSREEAATHLDRAALRALAAAHLRPGAETRAALADVVQTDPRLTVLRRSGLPLLALQADERTAVSVDEGGTVTRWDLARRRPVGEPWRVPGATQATVSGDLGTLATAQQDGRVQLWDLSTRRPRGPARRVVAGDLNGIALDHRGRHLVGTEFDPRSSLWDVRSGWRRVPIGAGEITIASDGRRATIVPEFGRGRVVSVPSGRRLAQLPPDVVSAWFTADGRRLLLDYEQGQELRTLDGRRVWRGSNQALAHSPDGSLVVLRDDDEAVIVEDPREHRTWPALSGLGITRGYWETTFAGPAQVLSEAEDGAIGLWHIRSGPALRTLYRPDLSGLATDARTATSWTNQGRLSIVDLTGNRTLARVQAPTDGFYRVTAVSPGGRWVALAGTGPSRAWDLWLWDRRRGGPMVRTETADEVVGLGFRDDGQLAAVGLGGSLTTVDLGGAWPPVPRRAVPGVRPAEPAPTIDMTAYGPPQERAGFLPGGRRVLTIEGERLIEYDLDAGTRRERATASAFAVAGGGRAVATVGSDGTVKLWCLPQWTPAATVIRLTLEDGAPALSRHGEQLAVAGSRGVTVWDTATGTRLITMGAVGADRVVWDGDQLVGVDSAGGLSRWDLSLAGLERRACAIANRTLTRDEWRALLGDRPYARLC